MAQISFIHDDSKLGGYTVVVTKDNVDFLGDVAEMFLQFLRGAGYTYVEQVEIHTGGGESVYTDL